jgi:prepilin-type N-terminal cleavage/methylation domain-containing protein
MNPAASIRNAAAGRRRAFTLIEIMVVVGIIGMIMAMGIPSLYRLLHREGFRKDVEDVVEVCDNARARAILQGITAEVIFHPQDGRCELEGGGGSMRPHAPGSTGNSADFGKEARIEMLDINLREYRDAQEARVRFYPNGTSDEMTLILRSDRNEYRKISLEITTGLASVESVSP